MTTERSRVALAEEVQELASCTYAYADRIATYITARLAGDNPHTAIDKVGVATNSRTRYENWLRLYCQRYGLPLPMRRQTPFRRLHRTGARQMTLRMAETGERYPRREEDDGDDGG
jgi:hypothetical protein